jgi:hypothetical protein
LYTILIGLQNGTLLERQLGDLSYLHGLAGHFIEEFRQEHASETN